MKKLIILSIMLLVLLSGCYEDITIKRTCVRTCEDCFDNERCFKDATCFEEFGCGHCSDEYTHFCEPKRVE